MKNWLYVTALLGALGVGQSMAASTFDNFRVGSGNVYGSGVYFGTEISLDPRLSLDFGASWSGVTGGAKYFFDTNRQGVFGFGNAILSLYSSFGVVGGLGYRLPLSTFGSSESPNLNRWLKQSYLDFQAGARWNNQTYYWLGDQSGLALGLTYGYRF